MNKKRCLKCDHVAAFDGGPPLACPECGAIYSKVERAAQEEQPMRPLKAAARQVTTAPRTDVPFVEQLRGESLYPNFRGLVRFWYWFGLVVGVGMAIIAAEALFRGKVTPGLISMGTAIFIVFLSKVAKEISLMVADLSDAAVRLAAHARVDE